MRRILCFLAFLLVTGVYCGYYFGEYSIVICLSLFVVAFFKLVLSRSLADVVYPISVLIFLLSALLIINQGDIRQKALYPYLDEYIDVVFELTERPEIDEEKMTFRAKIIELSFLEERIEPMESVRLSYRNPKEPLAFGDVASARIRLNLPKDASNTGGFDYNLHLKTEGIFFTGYVDADSLLVIGKKQFDLFDWMKNLNYQMCDLFDRTLTADTASVMKGILLGDKSGMTDEMQTLFSRSGLSHIVAVSGMHISTLLTVLFALYRMLGLKRFRMAASSILVIVFYVLLSGASVSAVRAGVMATVAVLAEANFRRTDSYTSLAVTASILLLVEPFAAFDIGFLLSCGAVLGILLYQKPLMETLTRVLRLSDKNEKIGVRLIQKVLSLLTTSISAQLLTLPVILYFFQEASLLGLLSNLIVLPLLPFIMGGGLITCFFGLLYEPLAVLPAGAVYLFLLIVEYTARFFGSLQFGRIIYGKITPFFLYSYGLMLLSLFHILKKKPSLKACMIPLGAALMLLIIGVCSSNFYTDIARVHFINVGQGDACYVSLPKGIDILIDGAGTAEYQDYYDIGGKVIRPYLLKQGVDDIEYMIASHGHDDHIKGLISILRDMSVKRLYVPLGFGTTNVSKELLRMAEERAVPVIELSAGESISICEGANIEILMPDAEWAESLAEEDENLRSMVMQLTYGESSVLFTGDIGGEAEARLIERNSEKLGADVLKVAHHGAEGSSSEEFLSVVMPEYAFIPVGKNQYGHPNDAVLERLAGAGASIYRADVDKDVVVTMNLTEVLAVK